MSFFCQFCQFCHYGFCSAHIFVNFVNFVNFATFILGDFWSHQHFVNFVKFCHLFVNFVISFGEIFFHHLHIRCSSHICVNLVNFVNYKYWDGNAVTASSFCQFRQFLYCFFVVVNFATFILCVFDHFILPSLLVTFFLSGTFYRSATLYHPQVQFRKSIKMHTISWKCTNV